MIEGKQNRNKPPPDGDANERPGWDGIVRSEAAELQQHDPILQATMLSSRSRLTGHALEAQLAIDELSDGLRDELKKKLAPTVKDLKAILASGGSYQDMRKRLIDLYRDWDPKDAQQVLKRAMLAAQLIGRVSRATERN